LRLLIGKGRYSDDLNLPNRAHGVMVRSPHAHARIHSIDIRAAQRTTGTLAVLTGRDFLADGLNPIPFLDRRRDREPGVDGGALPGNKNLAPHRRKPAETLAD
jgi:carbon-monoxide dehydrogenase large subunit